MKCRICNNTKQSKVKLTRSGWVCNKCIKENFNPEWEHND